MTREEIGVAVIKIRILKARLPVPAAPNTASSVTPVPAVRGGVGREQGKLLHGLGIVVVAVKAEAVGSDGVAENHVRFRGRVAAASCARHSQPAHAGFILHLEIGPTPSRRQCR